ncbi:WD40 repeat-like protein [Trichocladium antarcticum]|uniref:WD40 repeat-like protein n=1 Tax=Trichocladium antarcticum TaxID=1450529 RepID=A0AAN6UM99_9PEZI|nr:WD40 repeat-like protein [Trichocladium antarcticum]
MASTPSNRIKPAPSNSPFLSRPSRPPIRPRALYDSCLSLQRVIGTTCGSPTGFDTVHSSFAYIAGGAVVVVDVSGEHYSQRFYRARPNAVALLAVSCAGHTSSAPNATPKANDSRNRAAPSPRESIYAPSSEWPDSPSSKTWTSRERIKAATCLALSRDGRYLAVGETGYAPRVLIFNLQDASSDVPLVAISEHTFGVKAVAWSPDTKYLATLGAANDGFLYLWRVDSRTGATRLCQQNRCTSFVKHMVWIGNNLITLGVRHIKVWRVEDGLETTPAKQKLVGDATAPTPQPQAQKPLLGRNILLGPLLDATFCCALPVSDDKAIVCSEAGQMKLVKVLDLGFSVSCIASRGDNVYVGGKDGQFAVMSLDSILAGTAEPAIWSSQITTGFNAMGFLAENLVTIDSKRSIDVWSPDSLPAIFQDDSSHIPIPGPGDPIVGIQGLGASNTLGASFFTWSRAGRVNIWDMEGMIKSTFTIPLEQAEPVGESDPVNQVVVVKATSDGSLFVVGDKLGVLRIIETSTGEYLLETKAHSSNCKDITIYEAESRLLIASCGRDRTVQLFRRGTSGEFEHFQTLEFGARVVQVLIPSADRILTCSLDRTLQVHDLVGRDGEPDVLAAIPYKTISLRASPSSMVATPDNKTIFVSLLDRSVCQFDFATGRLSTSFKCNDEAGLDAVVLDSLTYGQFGAGDLAYLVGISNTDKSVRVYDAHSGSFLDREWGHTEAINGVALLDSDETNRRVVSVGEDGTIMIWALDFYDPTTLSRTRDPSPEKALMLTSSRPTLRRVLSKAEIAEFQRSSPTGTPVPSRRHSPPNPSFKFTSHRRPAKSNNPPPSTLRTPAASTTDKQQTSPPSSACATPASVLSGLLDQYSERLVSLLDEKLRLRLPSEEGEHSGLKEVLGRERERPRTAGASSEVSAASGSAASSGGGGVLCEEPESVDGDGEGGTPTAGHTT